jgi:hypothetical protein
MSAETFHEEPQLLDSLVAFDEDRGTGDLIINRTQHIPDDWLSELRSARADSVHQRSGEMLHVASVPVEVCDELLRMYGFDVMTAPVQETVKMLKRYELDVFLLTNKRI